MEHYYEHKNQDFHVLSQKHISRNLRVFGVKFRTSIFICVKNLTFCNSECGKNFNSKKDLRMHQKKHRNKRVDLEEEYFTDNIENAEFVMANMAMDNPPDIDNATLALL